MSKIVLCQRCEYRSVKYTNQPNGWPYKRGLCENCYSIHLRKCGHAIVVGNCGAGYGTTSRQKKSGRYGLNGALFG